MARGTKVTLGLVMEPAEADGSKCAICDDMCFLRAFRFAYTINGKRRGHLSLMFCQSCGEHYNREEWDEDVY